MPPTLADAPPDLQQAIEKLLTTPQVQGLLLVGSRSRGYEHAASDYDLEVIVDDDFYASLAPADRIALVWDGKPFRSRLIGDVLTEGRSHFAAKEQSPLDVDHWPYEEAAVWFDRAGEIAPLVARLAHFPEAIWEPRLKLHYVEFWYQSRRALKIAQQPSRLNLALVLAGAVHAYIRCLFVLNRRWPPLPHWAEQALQQSNLSLRPPDDTTLLADALTQLEPAPLQALQPALDALLERFQMEWHREPLPLLLSIFGPESRALREAWMR